MLGVCGRFEGTRLRSVQTPCRGDDDGAAVRQGMARGPSFNNPVNPNMAATATTTVRRVGESTRGKDCPRKVGDDDRGGTGKSSGRSTESKIKRATDKTTALGHKPAPSNPLQRSNFFAEAGRIGGGGEVEYYGMTKGHGKRIAKAVKFLRENGKGLRKAIISLAKERKWKKSTTATFIGDLFGAAKRHPEMKSVLVENRLTDFQKEIRLEQHAEEAESSVIPLAKTDAIEVHRRLVEKGDEELEVFFTLLWASGQRPWDLAKVQTRHVWLQEEEAMILLAEGKGVAMRNQPYTITCALPSGAKEKIDKLMNGKEGEEKLFKSGLTQKVVKCMKEVNESYQAKSIRRGVLSTMAMNGVSIPILMAISGHARRETLMRYLSWGRFWAEGQREMKAASKKLW